MKREDVGEGERLDADEADASAEACWEPLTDDGTADPGSQEWAVRSDWSPQKVAVLVVSGVLGFVGTWKLRDGVYPSEVPLYFGLMVAGWVGLFIGVKMKGQVRVTGGHTTDDERS
jgi:hypothetical protein